MLTNFLTYLQGVSGGYITPFGFYVAIGQWHFVYFKDLAICFFGLTSFYYWFRLRRSRKKSPPAGGLYRVPDAGIVMNLERMGVGGKSGAVGMVPFSTQRPDVSGKASFPMGPELPHQGKNFHKNIERILTLAVRTGCEVTIEYINGEGAASERDILPRNIYTRYNKTYLAAWCYLRREERTFRMDRIISVRDGGESSKYKEARFK